MTAVEVAWERVYSASGRSGVVKAWTPRWEDATKEKVVSCLLFFSGSLLSAGTIATTSGALRVCTLYTEVGAERRASIWCLMSRNGFHGVSSPA